MYLHLVQQLLLDHNMLYTGEENVENCDAARVDTVVSEVLPSSEDVGSSAATSQGI